MKPLGESKEEKRKFGKGRPRKLTERDKRSVIRSLVSLRENVGTFSSRDIQNDCGLQHKVSNDRIRRCLKKYKYGYFQCRKKGLLTKEDLVKRLKFAKKCKQLPENIWTERVSFYFDGTGWVHKTNPVQTARTRRTRMWRKRGEGLKQECSAKGKKEGTAGRMAKFFVAIAYGKGVIGCHQYEGHVNGEMFSEFVREHFPELFQRGNNNRGKLFIQDGDPSQNSRLSQDAFDSIPCRIFKIPPRSPDLNPIENFFHLPGQRLRKQSLEQKIQYESYEAFCQRIRKTLLSFPVGIIDRTIASMHKRLDAIIKLKGQRTKY